MIRRYKFLLRLSCSALILGTLSYAQTAQLMSVSATNYAPIVAPDSIVSGWGTGLATSTTVAPMGNGGTAVTLPSSLGGVQLTLIDSAKMTLTPTLYMVSTGQINYVLPANTALGLASLSAQTTGGQVTGTVLVSNVAPGLFTADGTGKGVPAAQVLRVNANGKQTIESPLAAGSTTAVNPINLTASTGDNVYLMLYGTGIRKHSLNPVIATIGGVSAPVLYAGAQPQYPGLDQVNVGPIPRSLAGKGTIAVQLTVDGVPANPVQIAIQ